MPVNLPNNEAEWYEHEDGRMVPCHLYHSHGWDPGGTTAPHSVAGRKTIGMVLQPFVTRATGTVELDMWVDNYTAIGGIATWGLRFRQLSQEPVVSGAVAYSVGGTTLYRAEHSGPGLIRRDDLGAYETEARPHPQMYKSVMFTDGSYGRHRTGSSYSENRTSVEALSTGVRLPLNNVQAHYFWLPDGTRIQMDRSAALGDKGLYFVSNARRIDYKWPKAAADYFAGKTGPIELLGFAYGNGTLDTPGQLRGGLVGYGADTRYVPKPGVQDDGFNDKGTSLPYSKPYQSNVVL